MATNNIALPPFWKKIIKETDVENLLPLNNHLIKKNIFIGIEKLNSRELYSLNFINPSLYTNIWKAF